LADPEPFAVLSGGKAHFRLEDLVELVDLVTGLRGGGRGRKGAENA